MSTDWKIRWIGWRNRVLASSRFQAFAARFPPFRTIARGRAQSLFDLIAGFSYSQVVLAIVETGVLDILAAGPRDVAEVAKRADLGIEAAARLLRAAGALGLVEEVAPGRWMLGQQGAVLHANPGAQAMVRHHRLLYADLADPVALLRSDREQPTALSAFWIYARPDTAPGGSTTPYSELMATSQEMVSQQACTAYDFRRHRAVLDIGGGHGRFVAGLAERFPRLRLGIFDLPEVVASAAAQLGLNRPDRISAHPGDFFRDSLPPDYDCHTLVRILHDHDDDKAAALLAASRGALQTGGRLVIVEPMADAKGAERMGAYFELYLWTMGSGRPRTPDEIGAMLIRAGFSSWRLLPTSQPTIASVIVGLV